MERCTAKQIPGNRQIVELESERKFEGKKQEFRQKKGKVDLL